MAAGLGFKTFTTGEVLTAADTNGYLMQGVLVFASAAARDAAITSPQEGQCCYLKDTDAVQTYSGSAWVGFDDSNAIQNSIVDAKGDIVAASGNDTPARLAVGNNGDTLVADSSATTGLRWQGSYAAGKNAIINGDFNIWQRGTTFNSVANGTYTADRWIVEAAGGTGNVTRQAFTVGSELGNNGYFLRYTKSTTGDRGIAQRIEDVSTFAGTTITVSFWMKGSVSGSLDSVLIIQRFGSGGSSEVVTNALSSQAFTTSWVRYSASVTLPSISGKTVGAGNNLTIRIDSADAFTGDLDIWGVQVEEGSVATAFQTATGTLQGELAACQRYYYRNTPGADGRFFGTSFNYAATNGVIFIQFPVTMRTRPTALEQSGTAADYGIWRTSTAVENLTAVPAFDGGTSPQNGVVSGTVAGSLTAGSTTYLLPRNGTAYLGWSAEL
jgi:hypothetical protein